MNAEEYEVMYKQYKNLVGSEVSKRLRNQDYVEDVCQDVWLNAWRSKDTYDSNKSKLSTWLVAIAAQAVDKHLRDTIEKQPDTILDSTLTPPSGEDDEVDGSWIENMVPSQNTAEDDQLLGELMVRAASLSEQETAVFNLVYWKGWSYEAAAKKLGLEPNTIGPIVARLRDKLEAKELYHGAFTYHSPGTVWSDWSYKFQEPGPKMVREDLVDLYNEFAPDKNCSESELRAAIRKGTDASLMMENNTNG